MSCQQTIPNCQTCKGDAECQTCKGALELPGCTKITNCKDGVLTPEFACAECEGDYAGGDCKNIKNCKMLDATSALPYCVACEANYQAQAGVCVSLCRVPLENGACSACNAGYFASSGVCTACMAVFPGCQQCESAKICSLGCGGNCAYCFGNGASECVWCKNGYYLVNYQCIPCDDKSSACICGGETRAYCRYCGSDGFRCQRCVSSYKLSADMTQCVAQPYGVAMGFSIALAVVVIACLCLITWQCVRQRDSLGYDLFSKGSGNYQLGSQIGAGTRQMM